MRAEPVQCAVFLIVCNHAFAFAVLHDQIQREVFNEIVGIVPQRLPV